MADIAKNRDPEDTLQIRIWITQARYEQLKLRARHHDHSIAAEARDLMEAGERATDADAELQRKIDSLRRYIESHLEPLAFIAAMDSAYAREGWRFQLKQIKRGEEAKEKDRELAQLATNRLKRKLRELDDDGSEEDESGN